MAGRPRSGRAPPCRPPDLRRATSGGSFGDSWRRLLEACHGARLAAELEDMHAGVGAIDDVDVAARVGFDVVGLDRRLAAVLAVDLHAALVGLLGDRRDEVADLPGLEGIADIERAHAGIEEGDE